MSKIAQLRNDKRALNFDGIDDYISLEFQNEISIRTLSFHVKIPSLVEMQYTHNYLFDLRNNAEVYFNFSDSGGLQFSGISKMYIDGEERPLEANSIPRNQFIHLAFILDHTYSGITQAYLMTRYSITERQLPCSLKGLSLWNKELSKEEIISKASYPGGRETGLTGWWPLGEGSGEVIHDESLEENHVSITGPTWTEESAPSNLLIGGEIAEGYHIENFEKDTTGSAFLKWEVERGSPVIEFNSEVGRNVCYMPGDGEYHRISTKWSIPVSPGEEFEGWIKSKRGEGALLYFGLTYAEGSYTYFSSMTQRGDSGGVWDILGGTLTIPEGMTSASIWFFNYEDNSGPLWVDEVVIKNKKTGQQWFIDGNLDIVEFSETPDCVRLNGSSDYIDLPRFLLNKDAATLEIKLKIENVPSNGSIIFSDNHGSMRFIAVRNNGGMRTETNTNNENFNPSSPVSLEVPTHLTLTFDSGNYTWYQNGENIGSGTIEDSLYLRNIGKDIDSLNSTYTYPTWLEGVIYEVRVWNRPLSQFEVQDMLHKRLQGTEPGLVHYWTFDEEEGSIVTDHAGGAHGTLQGGRREYSFEGETLLTSDGILKLKGELIEGVDF